MLAVLPAWRSRGVGVRLKWAQREAVLERGLGLVTWTFDPMRAKNARLNLRHLGATSREFLPDLYGRTSSALHHGLATDRLLARWELRNPRVRGLAAGKSTKSSSAQAVRLNDVRLQGGLPVSSDPQLDRDAPRLLLLVPSDWDALCRADLGLAREWQDVVRRSFEAAFRHDYAATDVATLPDAPGVAYVLEKLTASPSRRAAPGRKTTRSRTPRRASRAGRRGAARAGRGRR
jgi:chorismate synthase